MPTVKKKLTGNTTAVSVGCGSSCRRLNLSKIFNPKPNKQRHKRYYPDTHNHRYHHRDSSSTTSRNTTPTTTTTAMTLSPNISDARSVQGFGWLGANSLAVEKDSSDPYVDFRESMLQMIMEKEIYGEDDLRELLNCFLQLNSPYYHPIIIGAFTEICKNLSN